MRPVISAVSFRILKKTPDSARGNARSAAGAENLDFWEYFSVEAAGRTAPPNEVFTQDLQRALFELYRDVSVEGKNGVFSVTSPLVLADEREVDKFIDISFMLYEGLKDMDLR